MRLSIPAVVVALTASMCVNACLGYSKTCKRSSQCCQGLSCDPIVSAIDIELFRKWSRQPERHVETVIIFSAFALALWLMVQYLVRSPSVQ
ncbi:hypothetical protein BDR07DRAFT_1414014, partial [Suillus spraguei]